MPGPVGKSSPSPAKSSMKRSAPSKAPAAKANATTQRASSQTTSTQKAQQVQQERTPASNATVAQARTQAVQQEQQQRSQALASNRQADTATANLTKGLENQTQSQTSNETENGISKVEVSGSARENTNENGVTGKAFTGSAEASFNHNTMTAKAEVQASAVDVQGENVGGQVFTGKAEAELGPNGAEAKVEGAFVKGEVRTADGSVKVEGTFVKGEAEAAAEIDTKNGRGKIGFDVGLNLVEVEGTAGKFDASRGDDAQAKLRFNGGAKLGAKVSVTDQDGDGVPEYGVKVNLPLVGGSLKLEGRTPWAAVTNAVNRWWPF